MKTITLKNIYAENPCQEEWLKFFNCFRKCFEWNQPIPIEKILQERILEAYSAWAPWLIEHGFLKAPLVEKYLILHDVMFCMDSYTFKFKSVVFKWEE